MNSGPKTPRIQVLDSGPLAVDCPTCYAPPGCRCALVLPVSVRFLGHPHPDRARLARWAGKRDGTDWMLKEWLEGYRKHLDTTNLDD